MILRKATPADQAMLEYWDEQPHVIAAAPDDIWDWADALQKDPPWQELLVSEVDGQPIGFLQIIDPKLEETHYWGDVSANLRALDIWIGEEKNLNKGYGTRMMELALDRCFANSQVTAILIDPLASNTNAHRFYERIGFQFVEERTFEGDDCFVYELRRTDWKSGSASK